MEYNHIGLFSVGKNSFVLDDINTWPNQVKELLNEEVELLLNYFNRKRAIEKLQKDEPLLRVYEPRNEYKYGYEHVFSRINTMLSEYNILGFHCTNLIDEERELLLQNGLRPLSKELIEEKLELLHNKGLISSSDYLALREDNKSETYGRANLVYCFHCLETFKDSYGLFKLLTVWGGEALYWDKTQEFIDKLSKIGKPTIVVTEIPYKEACHIYDLTDCVIDCFLSRYDKSHFFGDKDNRFTNMLKVVDVLTVDDERFELLTDFSKW